MKKVFLIPNAITAFGLTCGLFVIFRTSVSDPSRDLFSLLQASAILLLIAALADVADGAVARLIKAQSEFGVQFDSLSDAVNFGVAPALLVLKSLTGAGEVPGKGFTFFVILATMIYSLCGVLRLVRYNVQSKTKEAGEGKHFTGLPIPAAGSAAVSASLILISPDIAEYLSLTVNERASILAVVLLILGYFMVSRWKFPSIKALHFRVPSFYLVAAVGIFAVMMLYGILDYFAEAYFVVTWLYLLIAWSLSIIRKIAGKRSKTLADFEPEDEE
jgi:CDP-diacylglycerol--serine O-phosphatidyltransferase